MDRRQVKAKQMKQITFITTALLLAAGTAGAQSSTQAGVIERLQSQGYDYIEIKEGLTQTKVEAIRGTEKLEFVYDNTSGTILKQEVERAEADEIGRNGVELDRRDRDFVESDDDRDGADRDDDDRGRGDRDDEDDDSDDDEDGDDDEDDDDDDDDDEDDDDDNDGRD